MQTCSRGELVRFMVQVFVEDWMASAMIMCATIKFTHWIFRFLSFVCRSSFFRSFLFSLLLSPSLPFLSFLCLWIPNECQTPNTTKLCFFSNCLFGCTMSMAFSMTHKTSIVCVCLAYCHRFLQQRFKMFERTYFMAQWVEYSSISR